MRVFDQDTERTLLCHLSSVRDTDPSARCCHFGFASMAENRRPSVTMFASALKILPESYGAKIYACRDGDMFLLMDGLTPQRCMRVAAEVSQEERGSREFPVVDLFEIGSQWAGLEKTIRRKTKSKQEGNAMPTQAIHRSQEVIEDVLSNCEPGALDSIDKRRDSRRSPLVMVADDDFLLRTLAGNVLIPDYEMVFAVDGKDAIQQYVEHAPDILFLDIGMPTIDGFEVLEELRKVDPKAFIIMFSGKKTKEHVLKASNLGAKGFLGKPFTRMKLFEQLEKSPYVRQKVVGARPQEVEVI